MRTTALLWILLWGAAACSSTQESDPVPEKESEGGAESRPPPPKSGDDLKARGKAKSFTQGDLPRPSARELKDFPDVWNLYRVNSPTWPAARDRFKKRSDGAAVLLTMHLLRHYQRVNVVRQRFPGQLARIKREITSMGRPASPILVDWMILDEIRFREIGKDGRTGKRHRWTPDDLTRRDCSDMLAGMGSDSTAALRRALKRRDLGPKGRRMLARTLGANRDRSNRPALERLLSRDRSWQVRAGAATALGVLGDKRAAPALRAAARRDPDSAVRRLAGEALRRLAGLSS